MKIIFSVILLLFTHMAFAQCDESLAFSDSDKETFVQIYLKIKKDKPQQRDEFLYELADKHKITPQKFKEIREASETTRTLSKNEKAFVSELRKVEEDYETRLKDVMNKECQAQKMDYGIYQAMQNQYRSCMQFQRSLSVYFDKWMK